MWFHNTLFTPKTIVFYRPFDQREIHVVCLFATEIGNNRAYSIRRPYVNRICIKQPRSGYTQILMSRKGRK